MITPDSVRPKRPSTRPLVACVDTIKPRGFGFAQALGSSESIFLNEGRVRELGGPDAGLPGMLVTLTVAADAQGRLAAAKAAPLRLDDADAASLLWAACGGVAADLACGTLPAVPPLLVMAMAPAGIARPAALRALAAPGADLPARLEAFWAARPNWRPALLALFGELQGGRAWPVGWAVRDVEQATENAAAWARLCAALEARPRDWPAGFDAWPHWDHANAASIQRVGLLRISNSHVAGQQFAAAVVEQRRRTVMDAARLFEALTPDDHALAGLWCRRSDGNAPFPAEVAQMLTARAAEKAAAAYLNGLGLAVADVAIEQLAGSTDAWRVMDLNVDGMHGVDVKNIRRSKYGRLQSSRWKVKRFKRDASGAPVLLCGVSSPHTKLQYGALSSQDFGDSVRILGVTSAGEFAGLRRAFSHAGGITVRTGERLLELPAWAWDYPIAHYRQRDAALLQLREVVAGLPSTRLAERWRRGLPAVLLALWGAAPPRPDHTPAQQRLLQRLAMAWAGRQQVPRLAWWALFVLQTWAQERAAGHRFDQDALLPLFDNPLLRFHLGPNQAVGTSPGPALGIDDPAEMLPMLLRALGRLDAALPPPQQLALSNLTVLFNGVLVGTFPDGRRRTLLAHCGGRLPDLMIDCGHRPLVYGEQVSCACGRLICPKCGTCTDTRYAVCEAQQQRDEARRPPAVEQGAAAPTPFWQGR
ncbi:hypothetical protein ACPEH1_19345 [Stenotrophomonas sp. NPDC077421]|uniref:hypothetical protein n=1 Tax=Stenotrophomonas sp. NPDC077421 TaxID=3414699 RepID=UPI003C2DE3B7